MCGGKPQAERLKALLKQYDLAPSVIQGFPDISRAKGMDYICLGRITTGFVLPGESLALITEDEIFGEKRHPRKTGKQGPRAELLTLEDLKQGDLVVHVDHGIGRYQGLTKLKLNGMVNDFLLVLYQDDDKLYLPVDRMSMVKKYIGVEGVLPILDKMGGKSWIKVKGKAKQEVEKIAGELLKIYSARKVRGRPCFHALPSMRAYAASA